MKTIVWATLTANGNYARADAAHPPKKEALEDFAAWAKRTGNFVVGRHAFEAFQSEPSRKVDNAEQAFAETEIVVVSASRPELPGVTRAATPAEALAHLERRGHGTALVAGGKTLINAFLAQGLVDELVFNIAPVLESEGLHLLLPGDHYEELELLEMRDLGGGVGHLRYALNRRRV
jgi:dihydrofolate reductase